MRNVLIASLILVPTLAHAEIEFPPEKMSRPKAARAKKQPPVLAPAKEVPPTPAPIDDAQPAPKDPATARDASVGGEHAASTLKARDASVDGEQPASIPAAPVVVAASGEVSAAEDPAGTVTATVEPSMRRKSKWIEPYGAIAGGVHLQSLHQQADSTAQAHNPTVAVSRLGIRGGAGPYVTFASEFEASLGGPMGYGASVWEGQAAIAIRDQYVRYSRAGWSIAAGRVADPASYDYVSAHLGDLLFTDLYTRDPLLYSGADRGNGLFGSYQLTKNFTLAGTFHSTNPTGITGTLAIGGKLQPFDRPFFLAAAQVGNSQNNLPDQNLHIYFGSPAVLFKSEFIEAKAEVQIYSLDTQQSIEDDETIRGYNLRLGARGHFPTAAGELSPFVNMSRNKNEILDPTDSKYRLPELFRSYTVSAGLDLNITRKSGVGGSYALVDTREPDSHVREHYMNIGTTYWIEDSFAVALRGSIFAQQISGETMTTGARSVFMTARLVLD